MLKEKVSFITGGSRGIGKAIALELAKNGSNIAVNYRTWTDDMSALKQEIESFGVKSIFVQGDVSDFNTCKTMIDQIISEFERIDILINNAGITKDNLLLRMTEEEFDSVININLKGTFNITKHVVPYMMKQRSGRIINIASVVGVAGNAGQSNYAASKAGIIGFSKSIAKELSSRNILVNAVAPGFIETDMTSVLSDEVKENINKQIPLKRMGTKEDVAKVIKFLASDDSSYITGQVINIDGGMII